MRDVDGQAQTRLQVEHQNEQMRHDLDNTYAQRDAYRQKIESGSDSFILRDNEVLNNDNRRLVDESIE